MGLKDALRSLRGNPTSPAEESVSDTEAPEPTWFQPRSDGRYEARLPQGGGGSAVVLRFVPGGKVFESRQGDETGGTEEQNPCRGEYTGAGRFNVQRRFERIVSYAVLEMDAEGFVARRIDTADGSTAQLTFAFRAAGETP